MDEQPPEILLVEDNPSDARLILEALKEASVTHLLKHVSDGEEALAYLQAPAGPGRPRHPVLIVLDLNLPRLHGCEVLARLKADQRLRRIPVIVLTTSDSSEDVQRVYNLAGSCYVTKPRDWEQLQGVVRIIQQFWLGTASLPPA